MAEKSLTDLPRNVREQFDKGLAALERSNWDYAIELLLGVVKAEPAFLTGREALRKGALKKAGAGTGLFKKIVSSAGSGPALARAFAHEGPYVLNVNIRGARSPFTSWQLEGKK